MSRRKRHSPEMKLQVVLEVLREEHTVNEIAAKYEVHPNMVSRWKQEFLEKASDVFKRGMSDAERELKERETHVARLERKVGKLTCEVDWLKKNLRSFLDIAQRRQAISKTDTRLSVKRQADLLAVNRSGYYRKPLSTQTIDFAELRIMGLIDRIHTDNPTWGYRTITSMLRVSGDMLNCPLSDT